jgi:hypothetical protein
MEPDFETDFETEYDLAFYDELEDCLKHQQSSPQDDVDIETQFRNLLAASPETHLCKLTTIELLLMSSCVFENIALVEKTQNTLNNLQLLLRRVERARVY